MSVKNHIERVWIETKIDENPDLSYLGEYSSSPNEGAITTGKDGRHFPYFNPTMTAEQTGNPDSPQQDFERMEAYNRGDWYIMGIIAKATIKTVSGLLQTIRSSGLWGVESDSDKSYLREVACEELAGLANELESLGFGNAAIGRAIKNCDFGKIE